MTNLKLESQHRHIIKLIGRDRDEDGWATVSAVIFPILSRNMPPDLVEFEEIEGGGRARLTTQGESVHKAMEWL